MLVGEAGVLLPCGLLAGRPAARAGPGSTAPRRSPAPRARSPRRSASQDHPAEARVDRQLGQSRRPTCGDARPSAVERAELLQQLRRRRGCCAGRAGRGTGTSAMSPRPQRRHLQDDRGQVGAQDLRVGEARAATSKSSSEYSRMQMPGATRPAAAGPLVGRGLRDRLDRQPLHLECGGCSGRCARCRGRRRSGCPARSATSRRRWWRARSGGPVCGCEDPVLLGGRTAGRRAAASRCAAGRRSPRSASAVSRISRSPDRKTSMSPGGLRAAARRRRRRSPRSGRASSVRTTSWSGSSGSSSSARYRDFQRAVADLDRVGAARTPRRSARRRSGAANALRRRWSPR